MRRWLYTAAAFLAVVAPTYSIAKETDPLLLAVKKDSRASGKLIDDHTATVFAVVSGDIKPDVLLAMIFYKASTMSQAAGFERFAIVKQKVVTTYMHTIPIVQNCHATVVFLHPGMAATSLDGREPVYVDDAVGVPMMKAVIEKHYTKK